MAVSILSSELSFLWVNMIIPIFEACIVHISSRLKSSRSLKWPGRMR